MKNFYTKYRNLIGFGLVIVGGVSAALTGFIPFIVLMLVGVYMFASFPESQVLYSYVIADTTDILIRERHYYNFIPFFIVSKVLTLGKSHLLIPYKQEHFIARIDTEGNVTKNKITRKAYKSIREYQRKVYSACQLSREFMERSYTPENIGLKRKKARLIAASILAAVSVLFVLNPAGGIYLSAIYTPVFLPMAILWIPEYKDAKIIQQAYDRAMGSK